MVVRNERPASAPLPTGVGFRPITAGAKSDPRPSLRVTGWWMLWIGTLTLSLVLATAPRAAAAESAPVVESPKITQPLPAPPPAAPGAPAADSVIYPKNSPTRPKDADAGRSEFPTTGLAVVLLLLAAGAYLVFKKGNFLNRPMGGNITSRLAIEETRPLGNKQFLAVATYGDRKLLLAVCPGKIDLLCRLDAGDAVDVAPATSPRI